MVFRVSATAWLLSASVFATAAGAVGVGLRTDAGRDVLARYGIAVLNDVVHGTAEVGQVTGTLTDGLEARDVVIRGEDGTLLAHLPEVTLRYRMSDFFSARFAVGRVVLREPHINIIKLPNGRLNYQEVLGLGGPSGGGPAPLVAFRGVEIIGGSVLIRNPTDVSGGAEFETEMVDGRLMRVRRIDDLNATVSYARVSSPFPGENGLRFDIDELTARFSDPALDIRSLRGRMEIDGDSLKLDLSRFVLPESETQLSGTIKWPPGGVRLALDFDATRLAVEDARPFAQGLPWGLVGSGRLTITSLDADRIRVRVAPLRLEGPNGGGELVGDFGIVVHKGEGWTLENTDLAFDALAIDYLRPMMDSIPFAGALSGHLLANGPSDSLNLELSVSFRDTAVTGAPVSHVRGAGILALGGEDGFAFDRFLVDSADIALGTVRRLVPVAQLRGRLGAAGSLNGSWRHVLFRGVARHQDGEHAASVAVGTVRLDSRTDTVGVWTDLRLDSLDLSGVHPSYPRVPRSGTFAGTLWTSGYADSLAFRLDVAGPPGRLEAAGDLVLLEANTAVRNLNARFQALDIAALEPAAPPTELYGRVVGGVISASGAGPVGAFTVTLDTSFVAGTPLDSVGGTVRLGDSLLFVDSLNVRGPSISVVADGRLGMTGSTQGTLRAQAHIDSLGAIESLLQARFREIDRDSVFSRMTGEVDAELSVTGSWGRYNASLVLDVPFATSTGGALEGLTVRGTWPSAADGQVVIAGTLDSIVNGRFVYTDVELDVTGRRNAAEWFARARIGTEGSWLARGRTVVDSGATRIPIDFLGLLLPTHRWFVDPGAIVTVRKTGYELDSVTIRSEDGAAHLSLDGTIPRGGAVGQLVGSVVGLPLTDVAGLVQRDVGNVAGLVGGTMLLGGTATAPVWQASMQLNDGQFGAFRTPLLEVTAGYSDRRLRGEGVLWRLAERILTLDFDLPLDLALEGAAERQLPGRLSINAVADGVDLAFTEFMTPAVRNAVGRLDADFGITGSWDDPQLTGDLTVSDAGAFIPALGVTHHAVDGHLMLSGDTILVDRLTLRSGQGEAEVEGFVRLEALTRPITNLQITTDRFRMIDVPNFLALTASGNLSLEGPVFGATLTGHSTITDGELYFADIVEKQIINLGDTLYASLIDTSLIREEGLGAAFQNRMLDSLRVDSLTLEMGADVRLLSSEADIQLTGQVLVGKVADQYRFDGTLNTPRGTYRLPFGRGIGAAELIVREFDVMGGGVQYFGTPDLNAAVDIDAEYPVRTTRGEDITVFVNVGGTLYAPQLTLTSDVRPALPENEIISYLLFNAPSVEALGGRVTVGGFALSQLFGAFSTGFVNPLISDLGLPLDYIRIRPPGEGLSGTEIALGWQVSERTFVTLSPRICQQQQRGLTSNFGASLEYRFSQNWHFAASRDAVNACTLLGTPSRQLKSQFGLDVFWEKRY